MGVNDYRNNIRMQNRFFSFIGILRFAIIIAIIVGGIYYFLNKTNLVQNIEEQTHETFEQMVGYQYSDIGRIIKQSDKSLVNIEEFVSRFRDRQYKINGGNSMKINDELEVYYVYDMNDEFIYEIHDLGNGSIGVQTFTGYMKVYDVIN